MDSRKIIVELLLNRYLLLESYASDSVLDLDAFFVVFDDETHLALVLCRDIDAAMPNFVSFGHWSHVAGLQLSKRNQKVRLNPSQAHSFSVLRCILHLFVAADRGRLEKQFVVCED